MEIDQCLSCYNNQFTSLGLGAVFVLLVIHLFDVTAYLMLQHIRCYNLLDVPALHHEEPAAHLRPAGRHLLCQVLPRGEVRRQVPGQGVRNQLRLSLLNSAFTSSNSYKCAVFFENLTPSRNLTWIGALPDALKKAKNQEEIAEILGEDVTEGSFKDLATCDGRTANARCYTIVSYTLTTGSPCTLLCSWTGSARCLLTPVTGTSSTPEAARLSGTTCAARSEGG